MRLTPKNDKYGRIEKNKVKRRKKEIVAEKEQKKEEKAHVAVEKKRLKELKASSTPMRAVRPKAKKRAREDDGVYYCHICNAEWNGIEEWEWCPACGVFGCCDNERIADAKRTLAEHKNECQEPPRKKARKTTE